MSEREHAWIDATTMTDTDEVLICRDCGAEQRTTSTGRTTITKPGERRVTGL